MPLAGRDILHFHLLDSRVQHLFETTPRNLTLGLLALVVCCIHLIKVGKRGSSGALPLGNRWYRIVTQQPFAQQHLL